MKRVDHRDARLAAAVVAVAIIASAGLSGCGSAPYVKPDSQYLAADNGSPMSDAVTFFALGDWGTGSAQQYAVAEALAKDIAEIPTDLAIPPFVVGLGDNVYEDGLVAGWGNEHTRTLLDETFGEPFSTLMWNESPVQFYIVPGNHDYAASIHTRGRKVGFGDVLHQEVTAEGIYPNFNYGPLAFDGKLDGNDQAEYDQLELTACHRLTNQDDCTVVERSPLPESMTLPEVSHTAGPVQFISIDSQAMIERQQGREDDANEASWAVLDSLLGESTHPWNIVLGHHPIKTYGGHGGYAPISHWLWLGPSGRITGALNSIRAAALAAGVVGLVVGAPVAVGIGAFFAVVPPLTVLIAKTFRSDQDTNGPSNRRFGDTLEEILVRHGAMYLSGHEHSLQLIELSGRTVQVISGSAAKASPVARGKSDLHYSAGSLGYVRLRADANSMYMRFCPVDEKTATTDCGPQFVINQ